MAGSRREGTRSRSRERSYRGDSSTGSRREIEDEHRRTRQHGDAAEHRHAKADKEETLKKDKGSRKEAEKRKRKRERRLQQESSSSSDHSSDSSGSSGSSSEKSDSSSSGDESSDGRSARKRKRTAKENRKNKKFKDRKDSKKDKKGSKSSRKKEKLTREERKQLRKAKEVLRKQKELKKAEKILKRVNATPLTAEDYYAKSTEFRVWLKKEKGIVFEDLSKKEATKYFDKFVAKWNAGKLSDMYYNALPEKVVETVERTRHKWGFVNKLSEAEKWKLASTNDTVSSFTNKPGTGQAKSMPVASTARTTGASAYVGGPRRGAAEEEEHRERSRESNRLERKKWRKDEKERLDELVPRETGRDALIEKRREKGARLHGASKEKEDAMDGLDVNENTLMGGGDDFQQRLGRQKARQLERRTLANERLTELQNKEQERMKKFLAEMGLKPGERVQIAPRQQ